MKTKADLVEILNNHDCHLSEMDGCQCIDIRVELASGNYLKGYPPYKYHSKLITGTSDRDLAEALYQEVREDRI